MTPSKAPKSVSIQAADVLHRAARIEDRIHEFRVKRVRKKGLRPTVIPYAGYGSTTWIRVLARVVFSRPGDKTEKTEDTLGGASVPSVRGWRSFTSVFANDIAVSVEVDGVTHRVDADRGGVVDAVVPVSLSPGWHTIVLRTRDSDPVEAPVFILDPAASLGVVSDIDDTVMVTALPRPLLAAWNTFVLNEHARMPTPGMAVFLDRIASRPGGAPVIYLSTGAWNVAPTLTRFLSRNLYPSGPLLLTDWGPTHDRWFRSGRAHKEENLRRLAVEFPDVKWLLVGDDGQHDEEIYGEFAAEHPSNVAAVAIRRLSAGEAVLAGGRAKEAVHVSTDIPWVAAPDGAGLAAALTEAGVL